MMTLKLNKFRIAQNDFDLYTVNGAYPFLKDNGSIPVELVQSTNYFITLKVLPHLCVSKQAFAESKPYNITVDKFQLESGGLELI